MFLYLIAGKFRSFRLQAAGSQAFRLKPVLRSGGGLNSSVLGYFSSA
jgi:hypothetical protein